MIGETILKWLESRSFWDLLFVYISYTGAFIVYLVIGADVFKKKVPYDGALLMALLTLFLKPYLPLYAFFLMTIVSFVFVFFRGENLSFGQSLGMAIYIESTSLLGDILLLTPLIRITYFRELIPKTSIGIILGSVVEVVIPVIGWIIYKAVKQCRKMKKRFY